MAKEDKEEVLVYMSLARICLNLTMCVHSCRRNMSGNAVNFSSESLGILSSNYRCTCPSTSDLPHAVFSVSQPS
jgi:hypothetical protein